MSARLPSRAILDTPWFRLSAKSPRPDAPDDLYYVLEPPDYVTVLALTPDRRVVLVRQFRPTVEQMTLEFPSGGVDRGETPEQAARREVLEETGYAVTRLVPLGPLWTDTGRLDNRLWAFFAELAAKPEREPEPGVALEFVELRALIDDLRRPEREMSNALHLGVFALAQLGGCLD